MERPRIVISALRGGSGKTILSVGIIAAWRKRGESVVPFKKGPDYIDAGWLALAAGRPCYNLDTFLVPPSRVCESFRSRVQACDAAVIEGNRGLFDGIDLQGTTSTAELAKLLNAPVLICIDCTKTTRTMAAVVSGCCRFDPDIRIKGVVLNRVAGSRHERILRNSIQHYCGIPVLGAVPNLEDHRFPERHMGLVPTPEHAGAADAVEKISLVAEKYVDLESILKLASGADSMPLSIPPSGLEKSDAKPIPPSGPFKGGRPKIGIVRDSAFQFYYPENIEALRSAGADTVYISPLETNSIPPIDGLYIGGGFPETHARALAENRSFRSQLKSLADAGLPVYAECGGLIYLARELILDGERFPMAGVIPLVLGFSKRPQGHGYTVVRVEKENPYFKVGTEFAGHEFHYSKVLEWQGKDNDLVFRMKRGEGVSNHKDGICYKNVLATYTHLHALGVPSWAQAVVHTSVSYRNQTV